MEHEVSPFKLALMYYFHWNLSKTISKHDLSLSHVIIFINVSQFSNY